jgi:hypothetical protein
MNNNNLINIIDKYGGNDDTSIYTNSLLNKYKQKNDLVMNKIDHLETLLTDSSTDTEINKTQSGGKFEKYDLRNLFKIM